VNVIRVFGVKIEAMKRVARRSSTARPTTEKQVHFVARMM